MRQRLVHGSSKVMRLAWWPGIFVHGRAFLLPCTLALKKNHAGETIYGLDYAFAITFWIVGGTAVSTKHMMNHSARYHHKKKKKQLRSQALSLLMQNKICHCVRKSNLNLIAYCI